MSKISVHHVYVYMRKLAIHRAKHVPVDPSLSRKGIVSFRILVFVHHVYSLFIYAETSNISFKACSRRSFVVERGVRILPNGSGTQSLRLLVFAL